MTTVSRPDIISGPAIISFDSYSYYTEGDIAVKLNREVTDIKTSMHGKIDERLKSQSVEISFTPAGEAENIAKYFPYGVSNIGAKLFTATDKPLEILTLAGEKITWHAAALTKMPPLRLGVGNTLFGDMAFTCLGKDNTEPTNAAYFKSVASQVFSNTDFDETKIVTNRYTAAYGAAPYAAMHSLEGFEIEIGMELRNQMVDSFGLTNIILAGLTATARFTPAGLTEAQVDTLLALQDTGAVLPGESLAKAGTDLVITGGDVSATVHKAGAKIVETKYGMESERHGQLEFMARRSWTAGAANALFTFSVG